MFDVSQLCKKYKTEKETLQPWDDRTNETDKEVKDALNDHVQIMNPELSRLPPHQKLFLCRI